MNLNNCNRYDDYYEVYFITKLAFDPDKIMLKKNDILLQMVNKQTKSSRVEKLGRDRLTHRVLEFLSHIKNFLVDTS